MAKTIQQTLAAYIREESAYRKKMYERHTDGDDEDLRVKCNANWLAELATFVERLPNEDDGIRTLSDFGWPVEAFSHGTGAAGAGALLSSGFKGTPNRPIIRRPETRDLERSWAGFVRAAKHDASEVGRMVAIVATLIDDMPRSRARAVLGRLVEYGRAS